jgi:hypothetical protein
MLGMDFHYAPPLIIIQAERLWNITKAHGFPSWFTRFGEIEIKQPFSLKVKRVVYNSMLTAENY